MKKPETNQGLFIILLFFILPLSCDHPSRHTFPRSSPESHAFSSEKLELLSEHMEESGASAMLLLKDGKIIYSWGDVERKHLVHSIRKALLNSLYGIAIDQGKIDTSKTLKELGIDDIVPGLSELEKSARIADLLKSRSGVYHDAAAVNNDMLKGKPERNTHAPGAYYYYNNWDFNVLGAILESECGESIYTLFENEIALPLGMHQYRGKYTGIDLEDYKGGIPNKDGFYQYENSKSLFPAYHFRMSAYDLALYGQLYLQNGYWEGSQIIPEEWIRQSTRPFSIYDSIHSSAYGMLWKVRVPGKETIRNSFYHTGLGIHMLGIYPDAGLVLVHRVDTEKEHDYKGSDFYKMLDLVFDARE